MGWMSEKHSVTLARSDIFGQKNYKTFKIFIYVMFIYFLIIKLTTK